MDILSWSVYHFHNEQIREENISKNIENILAIYNCENLDQITEKGKLGTIKTIFKVNNWGTLIWNPKDFDKERKMVCLGFLNLDKNFFSSDKEIDIIYIIRYAVLPTLKDPNYYSLHFGFRNIPNLFLNSPGYVRRYLSNITGMSNGINEFKLGGEFDIFDGCHSDTIKKVEEIKELLSIP